MGKYKYQREDMTTVEEIQDNINNSRWPWLKSIFAFLYLFGPRISEALSRKRKHFTFEGNNLAVRIGILKRKEKPAGPYKEIPHIIRISINAPFMRGYLVPYIKNFHDPEMYLWPFSRQLVWKRMKEVNPNLSPHLLRHDRLMKLAIEGATEMELMDWAGWNDPRPASTYIRATGLLIEKYADKVK